MADLSVLIPARNEIFLSNTIDDILSKIEGDTEIIVVLDGYWPNPSIKQNPRLSMVYRNSAIGQRAATNEACRLSNAKYVMKVDAHCMFDKGFDVKMMAEMHDDWTMVPRMYNLHAFDWVCPDGHRRYQGPSGSCEHCINGHPKDHKKLGLPCPKCKEIKLCEKETTREMIWKPRLSRKTDFWRFDSELHFQYWGELGEREESKGDIAETMSLLGACWMLTREKYWELNICDEKHGSWGQQGTEVACKTWLSGGRLVTNKKTWFSHMFRTQGGDFGFPYPNSGVSKAREYSKDLWRRGQWDKAIYPLSWLVKKFAPVSGWENIDLDTMSIVTSKASTSIKPNIPAPSEAIKSQKTVQSVKKVTKGILYFTDGNLDPKIMLACQKNLMKMGLPIWNISLKPVDFGINIVLPLERGLSTLFKQILIGLEIMDTDIVFPVDHDILYHSSHFHFTAPKEDMYYYNTNEWKIRVQDGFALHYDCMQHHAMTCYRKLLLEHYRRRVKVVEDNDGKWDRRIGFEPGSHHRKERLDDYKAETWVSKYPNLDIRHDANNTKNRWSKEQFRDQRNCQNWQEAWEVSYWGITKGDGFNQILERIINDKP